MADNFFGIKVSKEGIPVNQASDKQLIYKDDFNTKTYFDNTNSRMVEGLLPDGSYGLWVSKPGFDANDPTAASSGNLVFNSNQDILKVVASGTTSLVGASLAPGATETVTVPHNLGITPAFQVYANSPLLYNANGIYNLPISYCLTGSVLLILSARIDSTNLYIDMQNVSSSTQDLTGLTWTIRYYILQETAA